MESTREKNMGKRRNWRKGRKKNVSKREWRGKEERGKMTNSWRKERKRRNEKLKCIEMIARKE